MPEMNNAVESEADLRIGKKTAFLIQNIGLLVGFGLMFMLAVYGGQIDFTA